MGGRSFREFRDELFRVHAEGRHADALALVQREAPHFPDRWETLYWQICLSALVGDLDGAIAFLQDTVDRGHWWSEGLLRGEPDLKVLQGDARFEALVAICRQRHAQAQTRARPELLVLRPEREPPWPLLIALHGSVGEAKEFTGHWRPATADGWLVAVPQSSQLVGPARYGWADRDRAAREIIEHYQALVHDHPVDLTRAVVAGFSQGGATAIEMALAGSLPVRGVFGVACAPRNLDEVRAVVSGASERKIRVYLVIGGRDHRLDRARHFCEVLKSAGMAVRLEVRPGLGHELPHDFDQSLTAGLRFLLG